MEWKVIKELPFVDIFLCSPPSLASENLLAPSSEPAGYLLYIDLLYLGGTVLIENMTQRGSAAYLNFWTALNRTWNVWLWPTSSWQCPW